ncbi:uncharacterized protein LOC125380440 [Haliotis rufescens]|uniref:uncharacterized protein LOC125380440 n=1 Tax=Haliotis rufescens TaxID=6454 RepID=UPI00201F904A|nr:uncharacterized protein LOC125380440 [Haliotis rufescens]
MEKDFPKGKFQRAVFVLATVGIIILLMVARTYHPGTFYLPAIETYYKHGTCPSVLEYMVAGSWATRPITQKEEDEIEAFLLQGLYAVNGSNNFELTDKRCGNLGYYPWKSSERMADWTRALCNPRGSNPCCYNNTCQLKTFEECVCTDCYDLRPQLHAEFSKWIPNDNRCQVKTFSPTAACELLRGGTYHFYGDSIVRMVFLALIIILKGDNQYGGLRSDAPADIKKICYGMYVFPNRNCRAYLDYTPKLCNGTVSVLFRHYPQSNDVPKMRQDVKLVLGKPKSIIFFGAGSWQQFDQRAMKKYSMAVITLLKNETWPKLIWSGFHYFGLWHRQVVSTSDNEHAEPFNRYMEDLVGAFNVPVFDTFNMTKGVRSVDGVHYGPGVNFVKAQIFLNYILELQRHAIWT